MAKRAMMESLDILDLSSGSAVAEEDPPPANRSCWLLLLSVADASDDATPTPTNAPNSPLELLLAGATAATGAGVPRLRPRRSSSADFGACAATAALAATGAAAGAAGDFVAAAVFGRGDFCASPFVLLGDAVAADAPSPDPFLACCCVPPPPKPVCDGSMTFLRSFFCFSASMSSYQPSGKSGGFCATYSLATYFLRSYLARMNCSRVCSRNKN